MSEAYDRKNRTGGDINFKDESALSHKSIDEIDSNGSISDKTNKLNEDCMND